MVIPQGFGGSVHALVQALPRASPEGHSGLAPWHVSVDLISLLLLSVSIYFLEFEMKLYFEEHVEAAVEADS